MNGRLSVRRCASPVVTAGLLLAAAAGSRGWAQQLDPATVVARVDGQEIRAAAVTRLVDAALGGRSSAGDPLVALQAQALEQAIGQRLVMEHLRGLGQLAGDPEVDRALALLETQAAVQQTSLEAMARQKGLTVDELREQLRWELSWKKFSAARLDDKALEEYFAAHRREFDGTEVRVSHILLRFAVHGDAASVQAAVARANGLRQQIAAGKLTFADAARQFSDGPSRQQGGDLGFIPRRDRMVEPFSAAAFALEKGQISQPVVTPFGVHLIQVTDDKPGDKTWRDVRDQLLAPAAQQLFVDLVAELRKSAQVQYTGTLPYLDPATRNLVIPRQ